ncbi:hypothetical protein KEJ39_06760, partial [Candidatus Bathyarchaeota archaeon]|nr:hypothetical protein [Candidatus Bathyarchaeota archaeon]
DGRDEVMPSDMYTFTTIVLEAAFDLAWPRTLISAKLQDCFNSIFPRLPAGVWLLGFESQPPQTCFL